MIGEWIKRKIEGRERSEDRERLDRQYKYLVTMPANTFAAIYAEFYEFAVPVLFNDEWYCEWQIYYASLSRDEGYEMLL